jgi:hypothetical protein
LFFSGSSVHESKFLRRRKLFQGERKRERGGGRVADPAFKLRISVSKLAEDKNFEIQARILNPDQIGVVYSKYTAV